MFEKRLEKRYRVLFVSLGLLLSVGLISCTQKDNSGSPDSLEDGFAMPSRLGSTTSAVTADTLTVDVELTDSGGAVSIHRLQKLETINGKIRGEVTGIAAGNYDMRLLYFLLDGTTKVDVVVTDQQPITVSSTGATPAVFTEPMNNYPDGDGDGHSNIHELDKGFNWQDDTDFPAPDDPILQVFVKDLNVDLSWKDVGGVDSYTVYVSETPITEGTLGEATAYTVQSSPFRSPVALTKDTPYYFVVQGASIAKGDGDASAPVSINPRALIPADFTIRAGDSQASFSWNNLPARSTAIDLYMQNTPSVQKTGVARLNGWMSHSGIPNGFTHPSLANGKPYYFALTARNGSIESSAIATEIMIQPKADDPTGRAPKDVGLHVVGDTVELVWTSVAGEVYSIYHSTSLDLIPGKENGSTRVTADGTTPFDLKVNQFDLTGTNFFSVSVTGSSQQAESDESPVVGFSPQNILPAPTNLIAEMVEVDVNTNLGTVLLNWNPVPGADTYNVYMGPNMIDAVTFTGELTGEMIHAGIPRASFPHPGVTSSKPTYFRVSAVNEYGESALSNEQVTAQVLPNPVAVPTVGDSYLDVIAALTSGGTAPSQLNVNIIPTQSNDFPSVQVVDVTIPNPDDPLNPLPVPGSGTVQEGTTINLEVSLPLDGDEFLTAGNGAGSLAGANAYYTAVDPDGLRTTFLLWKKLNGIAFVDPVNPGDASYEVPDAQGMFYNRKDHELARVVSLKKDQVSGNIAFYADHFATLEDAVGGDLSKLIETVAIEISPPTDAQKTGNPRFDGPYLKFFAFNKDGLRVPSINMDGRGEKFVPEVCVTCHAGNATTYLDNDPNNTNPASYPDNGNLGARLVPIDLDAFDFLESDPVFNRVTQEPEFRLLNEAVMNAYGAPRTKEVITDNSATGGTTINDFCELNPVPPAVATGAARCVDQTPGNTSLSAAVYFQEGVVNDVNVTVASLTHSDLSELTLQLVSPAGAVVPLAPGNMNGTTISGLIFDDEATSSLGVATEPYTGSFKPATALSTLDGEDGVGRWQLQILDNVSSPGDVSMPVITGWTLTLELISPVVELIQGWYDGEKLPSMTQNGNFIPRGWDKIQSVKALNQAAIGLQPQDLYNRVIKESCRMCHLQRGYAGSILDFATWDNFNKDAGDPVKNRRWLHRLEQEVFIEGNMPRAFPTFKNFWLSDQPQILASFVRPGSVAGDAPLYGGTKGPGRPYVHAGEGHNVVVGTPVTLSAKAVHFSNAVTYNWTLTTPAGSVTTALSNPSDPNPVITPDVPGEYVAELTVLDSSANPIGSVGVDRVFATDVTNPNSFVDIAKNILKPGCIGCHRAGGTADHTGFLVDRELFDRVDIGNNNNTTIIGVYDLLVNQDRRIDPNNAANSRLLKKPSMATGTEHAGGVRWGFDIESLLDPTDPKLGNRDDYDTILNWINLRPAQGVPPEN